MSLAAKNLKVVSEPRKVLFEIISPGMELSVLWQMDFLIVKLANGIGRCHRLGQPLGDKHVEVVGIDGDKSTVEGSMQGRTEGESVGDGIVV